MPGPRSSPNIEWLASLSPWPEDGFGLDRMHELLAALGEPQDDFPAIHVVGTNGKSTATRVIEALLLHEGLSVGATVSPHVRSWSERVTVDGREVDLERVLARVRDAAVAHRATQFETITAAALCAFSDGAVDAAVVEAGLGGRHDATNVLHTRVVLLTSVGLDHTDVLGDTLEAIATEKLAVARPGATVVLPDLRFASLVPPDCTVVTGGAHQAAEVFIGHSLAALPPVALPGRLERREREVRDGAHNPDGVRWLVDHLAPGHYVVCAAILADKDVEAMLTELARLGDTLVATSSSNARALSAAVLGEKGARHFARVEVVPRPQDAVARAHELGEPVLVTGSLYLLADLEAAEHRG